MLFQRLSDQSNHQLAEALNNILTLWKHIWIFEAQSLHFLLPFVAKGGKTVWPGLQEDYDRHLPLSDLTSFTSPHAGLDAF